MTTIRLTVALSIFIISSCEAVQNPDSGLQPCSEQWIRFVEKRLPTGDSEGHGPDLGSLEWRSVVEFKLGIRSDPTIPSRDTNQWCTYIDALIPKTDT